MGIWGADYRGATTKSNNTAELTALLHAVEEELARPHAPVEICADLSSLWYTPSSSPNFEL